MRLLKLVCCFFVGAILLHSCKDEPKKVIKTEPIAFKKEGELTLFKAKTDSVLSKLSIEIADNDYETETGLMYRQGMQDDQGMLFVFPNQAMHSFYMKNTEFALDLIFIKSDMSVASFQQNAQPLNETSLSSKVPVKYVLEVNAGLVSEWGLKVGDSISYQ
ncbi:hypothetical protein SAMN05421636_105383 [Pricia antarctica]|uniref:DUF192 domain-containing protein n=1 Tax=Pricia antarctica TaxID=641691 RepID=A0A1G7DLW1_9FLAO|nr:DUF192 domain-containing protein [Pricia antarctica]SDE52511.1 hypothetical protein SAMN05421636_105383 [Pricia antarctica]